MLKLGTSHFVSIIDCTCVFNFLSLDLLAMDSDMAKSTKATFFFVLKFHVLLGEGSFLV